MITGDCPHCGNKAQITYFPKRGEWTNPLLGWVADAGFQQRLVALQADIGTLVGYLANVLDVPGSEGRPQELWRVGRCESCRKPVFLVLDANYAQIIRIFPAVSVDLPRDVPTGAGADYSEARMCLSFGANKAAVAMCRRALQAAALDKGCKREKLQAQLDALVKDGVLNSSLAEVAHQVRHFGNYGAHPDADGLGEVAREEATSICELTWQVLEDLYVNPARVAAVKSALAAKRSGSAQGTEGVSTEAAVEQVDGE